MNPQDIYNQNRSLGYMRPNQPVSYQTRLGPAMRSEFINWIRANHVPYDPSQTSDYDMPGFFQDAVMGNAESPDVNPYDHQIHFSDRRKTPFHASFSRESMWANPETAPAWSDNGYQLVDPRTKQEVFNDKTLRRFGQALGR